MYSKIISRILKSLFICIALSASAHAKEQPTERAKLDIRNGQTTLLVDGKPFIILGGELYNSSASSTRYLDLLWPSLKAMHINTLLVNISWQQFEPTEGQFDYALIDYLIRKADSNGLRLVILWFGSWKNGESSYAPLWVLRDTASYPRVVTNTGVATGTLSVFGQRTLAADRRAYVNLSKRIRERDKSNRVIMMQVQNEVGILGSDFDYSKHGASALNAPVPPRLISHMLSSERRLRPELFNAWLSAGRKQSGSWLEVFGDSIAAREFALAWAYASYINEIAEAGRHELNVPTFVNAWIVQNEKERPGEYPAGGPVSRVMDIYKVAAPAIDLMAPDIYLSDFKGIVGAYQREGNPLFIPESTFDPGRAFYAIGQHCSLGYSPFGIDDGAKWPAFIAAYGVLREMMPLLQERKCSDSSSFGIHKQGAETGQSLELADMTIKIRFPKTDDPAYGIIMRVGANDFYIAGTNLIVEFKSRTSDETINIADVYDGSFVGGKWAPDRLLNGDDTFHNAAVRVYGRINVSGPTFKADSDLPPQPTIANTTALLTPSSTRTEIATPGIYRVRLYRLSASKTAQ